jgi:hypothetical protein
VNWKGNSEINVAESEPLRLAGIADSIECMSVSLPPSFELLRKRLHRWRWARLIFLFGTFAVLILNFEWLIARLGRAGGLFGGAGHFHEIPYGPPLFILCVLASIYCERRCCDLDGRMAAESDPLAELPAAATHPRHDS